MMVAQFAAQAEIFIAETGSAWKMATRFASI